MQELFLVLDIFTVHDFNTKCELYNKGITVQRFPLTIALEKKIDDDFMILINFNKLLQQSSF
jgi:hypothetical protein